MSHRTFRRVSGLGSRVALSAVALMSAAEGSRVLAQAAPQRVFSTHDHTTTPGSSDDLREAWVDVKAPGNGRIYQVGTIEVEEAGTGAKFSGADVDLVAPPAVGFSSPSPIQVVVIQCTDLTGAIVWQRYFYGYTASEALRTRKTNARAISVWPADEPDDVRVAICGETYDVELPASQISGGYSGAAADHPTGFVAVFDGSGDLQWSYQFYGHNTGADCAITDLSVRVEQGEESVAYDVVTYCGISSHGEPPTPSPLTPLLPFDAPLGTTGCFQAGGGDVANGTGQWDGIVGRLRHDRSTGATTRSFHSIVGGAVQDGLFGLSELDEHRFAVVGSTTRVGGSSTILAFPFANSSGVCWSTSTDYCVGVMMVFDASPTLTSQPLVLEAAHELGAVGQTKSSVARDIVVSRVNDNQDGLHSFYVVGSTDDSGWIGSLPVLNGVTPAAGFQGTHGGGSDGFVLWGFITPYTTGTPVTNYVASYWGGDDHDGLTGVQSWNEYWGHVGVVGFTRDHATAPTVGDVVVGSIFSPNWTSQAMSRVRQDQIGGSLVDYPTALGRVNATATVTGNAAVLWNERALGSPAGGGVTVDPRARITICGTSDTTGTGQYPDMPGGRAGRGDWDAVSTTYEMLPQGVYRTDGTGTSNHGVVPQPSGYDGGSSPTACMAPYGVQIGLAQPELTRILVDYEGAAPAAGVTDAALLATGWPMSTSLLVGALIQYGAPSAGPLVPTGTTLEYWATTTPATLVATPTGRWPLFPTTGLPGGVHAFTVQVIVLLASAASCDPAAVVASPGLVFDY